MPAMTPIKVLIACEFSGRVREAFAARGHYAVSCDLLETEIPCGQYKPESISSVIYRTGVKYSRHYTGNVMSILDDGWDVLIAHPPCTFLSNSGVHWLHKEKGRWQKMEKGARFFKRLLTTKSIPKRCVENPIMHGYAREIIGIDWTQNIQPWMFGEDASKQTLLWLVDLPELQPTKIIKKERYANQTASGQNNLSPSETRWMDRSRTYTGIAKAMAKQWG